jgi:hypothetical protein
MDTQSIAWTFETAGAVRNPTTLTQKSGEPNYAPAFTDSFYDGLTSAPGA